MYELYKNPINLTPKQRRNLDVVLSLNSTIAQAYEFKETFADIMTYDLTIEQAEKLFEQWADIVWESNLEPLKRFAKTLEKHWYGILQYFKSRITNGIAEGINSIIKTVQGIARGFPNKSHLKAMVYLREGIKHGFS